MEESMTASYRSPAHIDPECDLEDPSNNFNWGSHYEPSDSDDGFDLFEYEHGRTAPRNFEPLAPRLKDVNPQLSSTLYNGRIAPENLRIRLHRKRLKRILAQQPLLAAQLPKPQR